MGKINVLEELKKDNNGARQIDLQVFADALTVYFEALANVRKNGAICAHPRTGAPIENPYLKVQQAQAATFQRLRMISANRVTDLLRSEMDS